MKYETLLTSFMTLALIVAFSVQVSASEVMGTLSSGITQTGSGSEVTGTLGTGTIASNSTIGGNVVGGSSSGGSSGGSGGGSGSVLGLSTSEGSNNPSLVLGTSNIPGFPNTGLGL